MLTAQIEFELTASTEQYKEFVTSPVWHDLQTLLQQRINDHYEDFVAKDFTAEQLLAVKASHKECHVLTNLLFLLVEQGQKEHHNG